MTIDTVKNVLRNFEEKMPMMSLIKNRRCFIILIMTFIAACDDFSVTQSYSENRIQDDIINNKLIIGDSIIKDPNITSMCIVGRRVNFSDYSDYDLDVLFSEDFHRIVEFYKSAPPKITVVHSSRMRIEHDNEYICGTFENPLIVKNVDKIGFVLVGRQ